jgi:large subunit ribosomal protein L17
MHRHGYKGRKFHRERDQREALIKSLAESLIIHEEIETTIFKAKEVVPYVEKLVTKAKLDSLHSRRQVLSGLQTVSSAHKLVDEIAPKLTGRNSGYLKIERTRLRRGDNAQLASVSFVFDKPKAAAKVVEDKKVEPDTKKAAVKAKEPVKAAKPAKKSETTEVKAKKAKEEK